MSSLRRMLARQLALNPARTPAPTLAHAAACAAAPALLLCVLGAATSAQSPSAAASPACADCAVWNAPQRPFRVFGNTYYVGTHGLSALLITSDSGHLLLDGGLPESAPLILQHIRELGFRIEDVRFIVNSHVHFDHAGGLAELQRRSGAVVAASPSSAAVLRSGTVGPDDPQHGLLAPIAPVARVQIVADGQALHVGPLALTAHATGGHTPGGTSWSWRSCEGTRCLDLVYADSQTPVSADSFFYTRSAAYPTALADFARGFATLETLPCDILVTPHPDASGLWQRLAGRDSGDATALIDAGACKRYAAGARARVAKRVADEGR